MTELAVARTDIASGAMTFVKYEAGVAATAVFDDPVTQSTIKGIDANAYLLGGLYEEHAETLEFDAVPPAYSRIGMVALHGGSELLDTYRQDVTQLERHRKEFGDELWYITTLLRRMGLSLEEVTGLYSNGVPANFDSIDRRAAIEFATERPLRPYQEHFRAFATGTAETLFRPGPFSRANAVFGARQLLGSMSWIAQNRLHTTLRGVAEGNMAKLASRQRSGTIFGKGDDR